VSVTECEACTTPAEYMIHGQWTIFDYLSFPVCKLHLALGVLAMVRRKIDGHQVVDLWIDWITPLERLPEQPEEENQ
jgi:hypothetical protein